MSFSLFFSGISQRFYVSAHTRHCPCNRSVSKLPEVKPRNFRHAQIHARSVEDEYKR